MHHPRKYSLRAYLAERLQEGTWANMVSNVRAGDKAQIRHQATRSAVGCSRPRWNCRPVALVSSCKPFLSTQQLPRHNATLKCSNVLCTNVSLHTLPSCSARSSPPTWQTCSARGQHSCPPGQMKAPTRCTSRDDKGLTLQRAKVCNPADICSDLLQL